MADIDASLKDLVDSLPEETRAQAKLSLAIANRIEQLMKDRGLSKAQFAAELGRRPSEVSKWLSGDHNFTIASLTRISTFFGRPVIEVSDQS